MMVVLITLWEIIIVIFIVPAVNLTHFRKSFFIFANHFFLIFARLVWKEKRQEFAICNLVKLLLISPKQKAENITDTRTEEKYLPII